MTCQAKTGARGRPGRVSFGTSASSRSDGSHDRALAPRGPGVAVPAALLCLSFCGGQARAVTARD